MFARTCLHVLRKKYFERECEVEGLAWRSAPRATAMAHGRTGYVPPRLVYHSRLGSPDPQKRNVTRERQACGPMPISPQAAKSSANPRTAASCTQPLPSPLVREPHPTPTEPLFSRPSPLSLSSLARTPARPLAHASSALSRPPRPAHLASASSQRLPVRLPRPLSPLIETSPSRPPLLGFAVRQPQP